MHVLNWKKVLALIITTFLLTASITYLAWGPDLTYDTTIEQGSMITEASYLIFLDDSTFYARNGVTGAIDFSSTNACYVGQTAYEALQSTGGEIHYQAATFPQMSLKINSSKITISGEGDETIFTSTLSDTVISVAGNNTDHVQGVIIEKLRIIGKGSYDLYQRGIEFSYVDFSTIQNCWVEDIGYDSYLILDDSFGNQIISCNSKNPYDDNFNINNAHRNMIVGCYASGGAGDSYHISQGAMWNIIDSSVGISATGHGFYLYPDPGCEYNTFSNNLIKGSSECGVLIDESDHNSIIGNTIEGVANYSVYVYASEYCKVNDNNIRAGNRGVYVYHSNLTTVNGNTIDYSLDTGIMISTGSDSNVISNNMVTRIQNEEGIEIYGNSDGNNLVGNLVAFCAAGKGIHINGATNDYTLVVGCSAGNNAEQQIYDEGTNSEIHSCWNSTTWIT